MVRLRGAGVGMKEKLGGINGVIIGEMCGVSIKTSPECVRLAGFLARRWCCLIEGGECGGEGGGVRAFMVEVEENEESRVREKVV